MPEARTRPQLESQAPPPPSSRRDVRGGKKDQKSDDKAEEDQPKVSRKRPSQPRPKLTLELIQV